MFDDRMPLAVARCANEEDVCLAVSVLSQEDVPVAVRGGGHHIAGFGTCHEGVVIDLGGLRHAESHAAGSEITVGGGATLHDVDVATSVVDRAVPLGVVSETGVGGLTLSGGIGWLTRLYGYSADNVVSARVVTANGEVVRASERENADLFWGLRGGGGNFGIVTEFNFAAHPVGNVQVAEAVGSAVDHDAVERMLRFYRDWTEELPRTATVWVEITRAGGSDATSDSDPRLIVSLLGCSVAPPERAREDLAGITQFGDRAKARIRSMRMVDLQHLQDASGAAAKGMRSYMKGEMITELTDEMITSIASSCEAMPTAGSLFEMGMLGGAIADRDNSFSAVGLRGARFIAGYSMMAGDRDDVGTGIRWARSAWEPLTARSAGGTYLNFSGDEDADRVLASMSASDRSKDKRLRELKRRVDPQNFLRNNHNIAPAAAE